jgi:hypothetical protein
MRNAECGMKITFRTISSFDLNSAFRIPHSAFRIQAAPAACAR